MCGAAWIMSVLLLLSAIGAAWWGRPYGRILAGVVSVSTVVFVYPGHDRAHCMWVMDGGCSPLIESPFRVPQAIAIAGLVVATVWWRRRRPGPVPRLRRLATLACVGCVAMTAAHLVTPRAAHDFAEMTLGCSILLLGCLVREVQLDARLAPRAVARTIALPPTGR